MFNLNSHNEHVCQMKVSHENDVSDDDNGGKGRGVGLFDGFLLLNQCVLKDELRSYVI